MLKLHASLFLSFKWHTGDDTRHTFRKLRKFTAIFIEAITRDYPPNDDIYFLFCLYKYISKCEKIEIHNENIWKTVKWACPLYCFLKTLLEIHGKTLLFFSFFTEILLHCYIDLIGYYVSIHQSIHACLFIPAILWHLLLHYSPSHFTALLKWNKNVISKYISNLRRKIVLLKCIQFILKNWLISLNKQLIDGMLLVIGQP